MAVEFYWASVAGAQPEPVEVTELNGRKVAYTCGCADAFDLEDPNCPVTLGCVFRATWPEAGLRWRFSPKPDVIERPSLQTELEIARIEKALASSQLRSHGWRGAR
jgi:hypothetical protein